MEPKNVPPGKRPFSYYLLVSMLLLSLITVTGITLIDYFDARENLQTSAEFLQLQTESNIAHELTIVDDGLKLFDDTLNTQMQQGFASFFDEYNRAGHDPSRMNLQRLKDQLGGTMDLYIINDTGVIQYTTFPPDSGLDFKTIPYFYDYLTRIRESDGFFPDRIVREPATGILRKYAYMPTPDHRYIFELGLNGSEFETDRSQLNYENGITAVASLNPSVAGVRIFTTREQLESNPTYVPDPTLKGILDTVIDGKKTLEVPNVPAGTSIRYLYVDLKDAAYASDVSRIVEVTYDTALMQQALDSLLLSHLLIALIALVLSTGFAVIASRYLTQPIEEMTKDIDTIAKGDLTHTVALRETVFRQKWRFSSSILMYLVLLIFFIVVGITAVAYVNADTNFHASATALQNQTEASVVLAVQFSDASFKLLDDSLNKQMEQGLTVLYQ